MGDINGAAGAVGWTEIQGQRGSQEDTLMLLQVGEGLFSQSREARKEIYDTVIGDIVAQNRNEDDQGSCLLVAGAHVAEDGVTVSAHAANLGDSVSLLLVCDAAGNLVESKCRFLNSLHDGYNTSEQARVAGTVDANLQPNAIRDLGIYGKRLLSGLAPTRAVGDRSSLDCGLSQDVEIIDESVALAPGEHAFLLVACDGLLECHIKDVDSGGPEGRNRILRTALGFIRKSTVPADFTAFDPAVVSRKLVDAAYRGGSQDNISVLIQGVSRENPPVLMGIFDGHGGSRVSKRIADNLPGLLREALLKHGIVSEDIVITENIKAPASNPSLHKRSIRADDPKDALLKACNEYLSSLSQEGLPHAKQKARIVRDLMDTLVGDNGIALFAEKLEKNAGKLMKRRYEVATEVKAAEVFFKTVLTILATCLVLPTLLSRIATGKFVHEHLFSVRGETFLSDARKIVKEHGGDRISKRSGTKSGK